MKLLTVAAGTLLFATIFASPGQAAPVAPASGILAGTASPQTTEAAWHGRRFSRGHHYGWARGRHLGWRHSRHHRH